MTRAIHVWTLHQVIKEALPVLRTLARVGIRSPFHRSCLCRVRDVLDNACNTFDPDEATGYFEEEYVACVDALGLVKGVLSGCTFGAPAEWLLKHATQCLERVECSTAVA